MTEETPEPSQAAPVAEIHSKQRFSIIWVVPLVALAIGGWLAYTAWTEKGPTITILFKSVEGLQVDKTRVRYKEVDIGKVTDIELTEDLSRVRVTVEMDKTVEPFLTKDTQFWIVMARVSAGQVSGLGTLLSGVYIGMEPGKPGRLQTRFQALDRPPILTKDLPGGHFMLHAEELGSIDIGFPVYYRKIKVGQVVSYDLDPETDQLNIQVFIEAPFHEKVNAGTKFFNASGVDIGIDATGIKVSTESLASVLLGGIAFESPPSLYADLPLTEETSFELHPNRESIHEPDYRIKEHYLLYFSESVRGLEVGAPVEFYGIKIGRVLSVSLTFDWADMDFTVPVLIEVEPERIAEINTTRAKEISLVDTFVERGLRAQLKSGSLITGQLFVDFKFFPDAPSAKVVHEGIYPVLPTVPTPLEEMLASVDRIMKKLEALPVEEIGENLKTLLANVDDNLNQTRTLLGDINQQVLPEINQTLQQFQTSMSAIEKSYSADSSLGREARKTLDELGKAARSIRVLSEYLQRHPEALIRGKGQ